MFFSRNKAKADFDLNELLSDFTELLALESNLQKLYPALLQFLFRLTHSHSASLFVHEPEIEKDRLTLKSHIGVEPVHQQILTREAWVVFLRRYKASIQLNDLKSKSTFLDIRSDGLNYMAKFDANWVLPLWVEERLIGIVNFYSEEAWAEDPRLYDFIHSVSRLSAVALENARLREHMLKQNEQLARMTQIKTDFNAQMTDGLRKPLTGILGMADYLAQDCAGELNPDQRRYLSMIQASAESFLESIDRLLKLSKFQSESQQMNIASIKLSEIWQTLHEEAQEKNIDLSIQSEGIDKIYGDAFKIDQLFKTLLTNAVLGGAQQLQIRTRRSGSRVAFYCGDDGHRLNIISCAALLETEVDERNAVDQDELGLNLLIAKRIVKLHEGQLWIEANQPRGARLNFTLPALPSVSPM